MASVRRFSSRLQRLDRSFLAERLRGAVRYRRIAGYFRSSIFELVGEEIAAIPDVRIVCNSELDLHDLQVSKAAREASLKERWNEGSTRGTSIELDALLSRDRYRRLYELLTKGNVQIRVVPKNRVFLHGKAGVIETTAGKTCFLGSINETKQAFADNYEILWEDPSPEGAAWVEEEFEALWRDAYPLPDCVVDEVRRLSERVEIRLSDAAEAEVPAAALVESPLYRGGEQLQPWQRAFAAMVLEHREIYGCARLLLADEVGLGKTLSLATGAMITALLGDGPVLILCPSTLVFQWQVELWDRLGIPSVVWISNRKTWSDPLGHQIKTRGPEDIVRCPYRIAIVSTGLIFHDSPERALLLEKRFGAVILDEAHKARRQGGLGETRGEPNNLLDFMLRIAPRCKNLLLGTATPIQTEVRELWDLMAILNTGVDFVLGREPVSIWASLDRSLPFVTGEAPKDEREAWELIRNPLPPGREDHRIASLRLRLEADDTQFWCDTGFASLDYFAQEMIRQMVDGDFFQQNNPIIRHTVLRRRTTLEDQGLLEKVAVEVHPRPDETGRQYPGIPFIGLGLMTNTPFDLAYQAAEDFATALRTRTKAAGFMKALLLQRICSSFASGLSTARKLLAKERLDDEEHPNDILEPLALITDVEAGFLSRIISELERPEARDPKLAAVRSFLCEQRSEGKTWLEHGCIIFSQYYDTALWVAGELARELAQEPIAVYAGLGRSGLFHGQDFVSVEREAIKGAVKRREIRLVVATDAACEGLNLQALGTLINVDLPWNPSRLEQRLGRIKRFGQARRSVDMLNLVYHGTQDELVYQAISRRLRDRFDIFGGLPDIIEDDWIDDAAALEKMMDAYIHLRNQAKNVFDLRYQATVSPEQNRWELCSRVLSRHDVLERLSEPW